LKHNDETRLDPVRILKSFAFQLALQLPVMADYIVGLDVKEVNELRKMDDTYNLLLKGAAKIIKDKQVILLIDALDEGDPREQQDNYGDKSQRLEPVGNKVTHYAHA